jgi:pimeloyl-ACP methyl ester carboxylesterase
VLLHGLDSSDDATWNRKGWIRALPQAGRVVITVDLPGHGSSRVSDDIDDCRPSRMVEAVIETLSALGYVPCKAGEPVSGVDVVAYSLGSRLAWDWAGQSSPWVRRLVLGAPSARDPVAALDPAMMESALAGEAVDGLDESDQVLLEMMQALQPDDAKALYRLVEGLALEPFEARVNAPKVPLLLVAGERDQLAETMPMLAREAPQAETLWLPGRNHSNAITARAFKQRAIAFLGRSD